MTIGFLNQYFTRFMDLMLCLYLLHVFLLSLSVLPLLEADLGKRQG